MNDKKRKESSSSGRLLFTAKSKGSDPKKRPAPQKSDRKARAETVAKRYALLLAVGVAYLIFCRTTGLSLPCPFHAATGLDCPGCGITRLMLALSEGDLAAAFHANEAIFLLGPILCVFLLRDDLHWILQGKRKEPPRPFVFFLLIAFAAFTIWRNFLR